MNSVLQLLVVCVAFGHIKLASPKEENWIDPLDMVNFDPTTNKMKHKTVSTTAAPNISQDNKKFEKVKSSSGQAEVPQSEGHTEKQCSGVCVSLFKQFIRTIVYHTSEKVTADVAVLNMQIRLTPGEVETLKRFTEGDSESDIHDAHLVISEMIKHVSQLQPGDPSSRRLWLEDKIGIRIELALPLLAIVCVVCLTVVFLLKYQFSWWQASVKLIFFLFCVSVAWTWYELYKREEAKVHHAMMKDMPEECRRKEDSDSIWMMVKQMFSSSFTFETDKCVKYYEHLLIDPLWKVSPTEALAVTFARFFLAPLRHIGKGISEFVTALLSELPIHLWPFVLIFLCVFVFFICFIMSGYRIRLPFITIEPSGYSQATQLLQALRNQTEKAEELTDHLLNQKNVIQEIVREECRDSCEKGSQETRKLLKSLEIGSGDQLKTTERNETYSEEAEGENADTTTPVTVGRMETYNGRLECEL